MADPRVRQIKYKLIVCYARKQKGKKNVCLKTMGQYQKFTGGSLRRLVLAKFGVSKQKTE